MFDFFIPKIISPALIIQVFLIKQIIKKRYEYIFGILASELVFPVTTGEGDLSDS
jgi:hypothetical protein